MVKYLLRLVPVLVLALIGCDDGHPPSQTLDLSLSNGTGHTVKMEATVQNQGGFNWDITYSWDVDSDGTIDAAGNNLQSIDHTYTAAGVYDVYCDAYMVSRPPANSSIPPTTQTLTAHKTITVGADFTVQNNGGVVSVEANTLKDKDGNDPINYQWDMESNGTWEKDGANAVSYTHTYATTGKKNITLRVTWPGGFTATCTKPITINAVSQGPEIDFNVDQGVTMTTLEAQAPEYQGVSPEFSWDIDNDGTWEMENNSSPMQPLYKGPGTYTIKLKVTWGTVLTKEKVKQITLVNM